MFRKIEKVIENHFKTNNKKILLIDGARQIGKTYIIRYVGKKLFENYIEINMLEDSVTEKLFQDIKSIDDFYFKISLKFGNKMKEKEKTLIFIDEIQAYPKLLTILKFLSEDNKYTFVASGSLLGVTLSETSSIPMGYIRKIRMYPLDFEEFLYANGINEFFINSLFKKYKNEESLDEATHLKLMDLFKKYLIVGGLPDCINSYLEHNNINLIREIQSELYEYYKIDASKYDDVNKLKIRRIYDLIPSYMENKKKRVVIQDVEDKRGKTFLNYMNEFEYLISSGISLDVKAISNPKFPLIETAQKNLLKLYLNDVGILTNVLFKYNVNSILEDIRSINLGSVYETFVAQELRCHNHNLFYYDNRKNGEVDFLIDDYETLSIIPIEVKSGRDYTIHSALNNFNKIEDYNVKKSIVLSNERLIKRKDKTLYLPIYYVMFI